MAKEKSQNQRSNSVAPGFEATLWADAGQSTERVARADPPASLRAVPVQKVGVQDTLAASSGGETQEKIA